jgi:DNA repair protein RecN (Recombination protein N)
MLISLTIQHVVLIEQAILPCERGMSVLTGETGAGKSIILEALGWVLGDKAQPQMIRQTYDHACVSAVFQLSGHAIYSQVYQLLEDNAIAIEDDVLVLRRIVYTQGKSKAFINDIPVTLALLRQIGALLVARYSQHTQWALVDRAQQLCWLDAYGGHIELVLDLERCYHTWQAQHSQQQAVRESLDKWKNELDFVDFTLQELEELALQPGELERLTHERHHLQNSRKRAEFIQRIVQGLSENDRSIETQLASLHRDWVRDGEKYMLLHGYQQIDQHFEQLFEHISAISACCSESMPNIHLDANQLEIVEARLFLLKEHARKHRVQPDELMDVYKRYKLRQEELQIQIRSAGVLDDSVLASKAEYEYKARQLHDMRQNIAPILAKAIEHKLHQLHMNGSLFEIELMPLTEESWNAKGMDRVTFMVRTNPGSALASLADIASGGELSRVMLALTVALSCTNQVATFVFDEIDTGVGGAVADAMGKALSSLASDQGQVLVITHQPQVAAYANHHIFISKEQQGSQTYTRLHVLNEQGRQEEIARMLSGSAINDATRAAAKQLLLQPEMAL